jgi:hypothetical protein
METVMEFPTYCFGCGAVLRGSWTRHTPACVLVREGLVIVDECDCRDPECGHPASAHGAGGECVICNRSCWL